MILREQLRGVKAICVDPPLSGGYASGRLLASRQAERPASDLEYDRGYAFVPPCVSSCATARGHRGG